MLMDILICAGIFLSGAVFGAAIVIALCGKIDGKDDDS